MKDRLLGIAGAALLVFSLYQLALIHADEFQIWAEHQYTEGSDAWFDCVLDKFSGGWWLSPVENSKGEIQ